jgi:Uma2 family endonuclease
MTALKSEKMTVDEFLEWCLTQEERYELVDGVPRLKWSDRAPEGDDPHLMTGARRVHDDIVVNGIVALRTKLTGGPCKPHTSDLAITVPAGGVRRPDILVDCEPGSPNDLDASKPVLVVEVLSRSTRNFDLLRKTAEYRTIPSLRYILHIDPDEIAAIFHVRQPDGRWEDAPLIGRDTEISMPEINVSLTLGDFYEGLLL